MCPMSDAAADLYEATQSLCAAAGLPAYEVSNHAALPHRCRHNQAIWQGGDYLGIGPGAHGRVTINGIKHASLAMRQPQDWLAACRQNGHGWQLRELTAASAAEEAVMLGLRLVEGRPFASWRRRGYAGRHPPCRFATRRFAERAKDVLQATEKRPPCWTILLPAYWPRSG